MSDYDRHTMKKLGAGIGAAIAIALGCASIQVAMGAEPSSPCKGDNGGLSLSPGFCATIFADNLGHVRHLVGAPDGTLYANSWSGRYFRGLTPPPPGGFLIALKDTKGAGHADVV